MTREESIVWLESLKTVIGQHQYQGLWHYEQALAETIELLKSDRIVELPCKVGQTVYVVDNHLPKTFLGIVETTFCGFEISSNGNNRYFVKKNGSKESFGDDDVGLSIFFTQKEAEGRLKELEK